MFADLVARQFGLSGYVRNASDGSVEVVADGKTRDLKTLAALKPAEVRPLIIASLDGMATCDEKTAPVERG